MKKWISGPWWAPLIVLGLVACGSLPKAAPSYASHDFGSLEVSALVSPRFPVRHLEVVPAPWLASAAMQYRLEYSQPTRRLSYGESRWAAQPAQLLEVLLRRSVRASETSVGSGGCRIRLDLDEFVQRFESATVSQGLIEARVALLEPRGDRLIAATSLAVSRPAPSPDAAGGVRALALAALALNAELLVWLDGVDKDQLRLGAPGLSTRCRH